MRENSRSFGVSGLVKAHCLELSMSLTPSTQQEGVTILPDSPGRLRDDMASPQLRLCLLVSGGLPDLPPTAMPLDMGRDPE